MYILAGIVWDLYISRYSLRCVY